MHEDCLQNSTYSNKLKAYGIWLHNYMFFSIRADYAVAYPTCFTVFWPLHCNTVCFITLLHLCFYTIYTTVSLCWGHIRIAGEVILSPLFSPGETHLEHYVHFWLSNTRKTWTYQSKSRASTTNCIAGSPLDKGNTSKM